MISLKKTVISLAAAVSLVGCEDTNDQVTDTGVDMGVDMGVDAGPQGPCDNAPATLTVSNNITTDTTWCTGTEVTLSTRVYVENGATLTVQPGVVVKGQVGSSLVITRSSHLEAVGTAAQPIVFTSSNPPSSRAPSDWGGVVLFGRAPNNQSNDLVFEGLTTEERNTYGGTDATWDCGTLRYVRIEFAGELFAAGKEFNGLTVASCGSNTDLSYIQVHRGGDDGIEFFGGTAGIHHAVVTGSDDDALDWDFGWTGTAQYLIAYQLDTIGDNLIEADNNAIGTVNVPPRAQPTIYNALFLGGGVGSVKSQKVLLRRGTLGILRNTIFQNVRGGLVIEPPTTTNEANFVSHWPTDLGIEGSYFFGCDVPATTSTATGDLPNVDPSCTASCAKDTSVQQSLSLNALVTDAARGNTIAGTALVTPGAGAVPELCAATGTAAVSNATTATGIDAAGLTYAGACAPGTTAAASWYGGWTSFPAN